MTWAWAMMSSVLSESPIGGWGEECVTPSQ